MEKKIFDFKMNEIKENENSEYYEFSGYLSVFGEKDHADDIVCKGAFIKSIDSSITSNKKIPVLFSHDVKMPVGVFETIKEDSHGLFVKAIMPKADKFVSERLYPQLKIGSLKSLSIGYKVIDKEIKDGARHLKEIELYEGSIVTFPCLESADILSVKKLDDINTFKDIESFLKDKEFSQKEAKTLISNIKNLSQRDADNKLQRDVEDHKEINDLNNLVKEYLTTLGG